MPPADADAARAPVHGHCEPRFAGVRAALGEALASGVEVGAALAVTSTRTR